MPGRWPGPFDGPAYGDPIDRAYNAYLRRLPPHQVMPVATIFAAGWDAAREAMRWEEAARVCDPRLDPPGLTGDRNDGEY
jgi:hypothetical protein